MHTRRFVAERMSGRPVEWFHGVVTVDQNCAFLRIPAWAPCAIQLNYTYVKWWNYP